MLFHVYIHIHNFCFYICLWIFVRKISIHELSVTVHLLFDVKEFVSYMANCFNGEKMITRRDTGLNTVLETLNKPGSNNMPYLIFNVYLIFFLRFWIISVKVCKICFFQRATSLRRIWWYYLEQIRGNWIFIKIMKNIFNKNQFIQTYENSKTVQQFLSLHIKFTIETYFIIGFKSTTFNFKTRNGLLSPNSIVKKPS